ncbi:condensation domain-containing protein [Kribbella sp. CA-293567]|uniref:condensation domain-containing protein n=1 Tax=Kribbella sp. CA-293567 TaxID=3002436 RepID=UPI0022DE5A26|nr:condensation domain-containing protein [Kribbella sp. CA-293567]WBQ07605.1 condensation domain-containing protein [Kribbella sp. CA-293567]
MHPFPLPAGMEALWERTSAISPLDPGAARYSAVLSVMIDQPLEADTFRLALQDVLRLHPTLRLCFEDLSADPLVRIAADVEPLVDHENLETLTEQARQQRLAEIVAARQAQAFDLLRAPLWRVDVVQCGPNRTALLLCFYHLLLDGWSMAIVFEDLLQSYQHRRGLAPVPPTATTTFDHAVQVERCELSRPAEIVESYRDALFPLVEDRVVPALEISPQTPLNLPRSLPFRLDDATAGELREVAWQLRTTVYVLFQTAYSVALRNLADVDRVIVSTTTTGRKGALRDRVVGQFTRDLYVPVQLGSRMSPVAALRTVNEALYAAIARTCSFKQLAEAVWPAFRHDRPWHDLHLFDSYIQSDAQRNVPAQWWGLNITSLTVDTDGQPKDANAAVAGDLSERQLETWIGHTAPYLQIGADRQSGVIYYNASFFSGETVQTLLDGLLVTLSALASARAMPHRPSAWHEGTRR